MGFPSPPTVRSCLALVKPLSVFGEGREGLGEDAELVWQFQKAGQPAIVPGDTGRASRVPAGAPGSVERTFGVIKG